MPDPGPRHALTLMGVPLDVHFHPRDNLAVCGNIDGDVTVFDYSEHDAGERRSDAGRPPRAALPPTLPPLPLHLPPSFAARHDPIRPNSIHPRSPGPIDEFRPLGDQPVRCVRFLGGVLPGDGHIAAAPGAPDPADAWGGAGSGQSGLLACGARDGRVAVCDVERGAVVRQWAPPTEIPGGFGAGLPSASLAANGADGSSGEPGTSSSPRSSASPSPNDGGVREDGPDVGVHRVAASGPGGAFAAADGVGRLRFFDPRVSDVSRPAWECRPHTDWISDVWWQPGGADGEPLPTTTVDGDVGPGTGGGGAGPGRLLTVSGDGTLAVVDPRVLPPGRADHGKRGRLYHRIVAQSDADGVDDELLSVAVLRRGGGTLGTSNRVVTGSGSGCTMPIWSRSSSSRRTNPLPTPRRRS